MSPPGDIEAQRALAQEMFPRAWAESLELPGFKRRRRQKALRDRAAYETKLAPLKAAGATCASCAHRGLRPGQSVRDICDLQSDFHGYVRVRMTDLCADWASDKAPKPDAEPNRKAEVEEIVRDLAEAMRMPTEEEEDHG